MLNACATALTDRLLCRFPMAQGHRAVYVYGFEITLSSLAVMFSVFTLSCLCGAVYTSITFSLIFVSIRLFSGGYHAKTYGCCFILSNDKLDVGAVQLQEAGTHHLMGEVRPGNPGGLTLRADGFHQKLHDLVQVLPIGPKPLFEAVILDILQNQLPITFHLCQ